MKKIATHLEAELGDHGQGDDELALDALFLVVLVVSWGPCLCQGKQEHLVP